MFNRLASVSFAFLLICGCGHIQNKSTPVAPKVGTSGALHVLDSNKALIRIRFEPGEIQHLCDDEVKAFAGRLKSEVKTFLDLDRLYSEFTDNLTPLYFMGYVHSNEKVRSEASQCEEKYNRAIVDFFTQSGLYEILKNAVSRSPDEERLISELKRNFEKNGAALSKNDLADYRDLKSQLVTLEAQFSKNLNENSKSIEFTADELEGLPKTFFDHLKKTDDGHFVVLTKSTDALPVLQSAKSSDTRRKMQSAYENVAAVENTAILEQAIKLRQEIAKKLGFATWADARIKGNMAQTAERATHFIVDLKRRLHARLKSDLAILLDAKKRLEDKNASELKPWDIRYFENQVKIKDYSVDEEEVRNYFPKDIAMAGMFDIYSNLFGVKFEEIPNAQVWSSEVKLYSIRDKDTNTIIGYFYTDFVPRVGKYGHAAAFPLLLGRQIDDDNYALPVSAIVANFNPPANGRPSLLSHRELETVFHEFGHIMHQTLTRAPYGYLSGSAVAQDFVEAPSQMLENWTWDPQILKKISSHYETKKPLSDDLIAKIISTREFNKGWGYSRQIVLGLTDLTMHTKSGPVNSVETFQKVHRDVLGFAPIADSHFCASFGHLMGGYDAGYYGYVWSEVFAADMFSIFAKDGLLNSKLGEKYRTSILEQGNMLDAEELLTEFLGRAPNNQAFLKKLNQQ